MKTIALSEQLKVMSIRTFRKLKARGRILALRNKLMSGLSLIVFKRPYLIFPPHDGVVVEQGEKFDDTQEVGREHHIGNISDFHSQPISFRIKMVKFAPKSKSLSKMIGRLKI